MLGTALLSGRGRGCALTPPTATAAMAATGSRGALGSERLVCRARLALALGVVPVALVAVRLMAADTPGVVAARAAAVAAACGPILAGATAKAQRTTKGKPRDDVGAGTTSKDEDGKASGEEKKKQRKKFLGIF